ncbi:YibE/F family protein [Devriesea agamarum]|uniref:YibE/F family protein n=1 Tax=Devriesea agamarum TaxID=472569 RepID=UPI00071D9EAA|nr:YibE/F family protein [Devriesea agamarum]
MSHSHAHGPIELPRTQVRRVRIVLALITVPILIATVVGMVFLWPTAARHELRTPLLTPGAHFVSVQVTEVPGPAHPRQPVNVKAVAVAGVEQGQTVTVQVPPEVAGSGLAPGDRLRAIALPDRIDPETGKSATHEQSVLFYYDHDRSIPLIVLAALYLLAVGLVARRRGLFAIVGLAAGVAIVIWFVLPAILSGRPPLAVGLVGSVAMMFPAVYMAHGISIRTTTALLGTFGGLGATVLLAALTAGPAGMTGAQGEAPPLLYGMDPTLGLQGILVTGVVLSGLGALNDVTITQASAVWELRAAMPSAPRRKVFAAAMRIGRDHIASTVYTLAFAYIGTAMPILLIASTIDRSLFETLGAGEIAEEIFRTLVASIGLILAIPLTTGIGALLASISPVDHSLPDTKAKTLASADPSGPDHPDPNHSDHDHAATPMPDSRTAPAPTVRRTGVRGRRRRQK